MRTRANGEELSLDGLLDDTFRAARIAPYLDAPDFRELRKDWVALIGNERSRAWTEGINFGARIEQEAARVAIAQAALHILGKDRGDGEVDLGALGRHYRD